MSILLYVLIPTGFVLFVTVTIMLLLSFRRTHAVGFLSLGAAVLLCPLAARQLRFLIDLVGPGPCDTMPDFVVFLNSLQQVVAFALLLVAVLYLSKNMPSYRSS